MAWTANDLVSISASIASGVRSATFADGRRIEYQSLDHMLAAKKVIAAELSMQDTARTSLVRRRAPYYRSGL